MQTIKEILKISNDTMREVNELLKVQNETMQEICELLKESKTTQTLGDYLRENNKKIVAINGFRCDESGNMVPVEYTDDCYATGYFRVSEWGITFYDPDGDPTVRFKFEGSVLNEIDKVLSEQDIAEWMEIFDSVYSGGSVEEAET